VERICRSYQKCLYHSIFYFILATIYNRPLSNLRTVQDITQQKLHAKDTTTLHPNVFWTGIQWLLFTAANRLNSTCGTTAKFVAVVLCKHHGAYSASTNCATAWPEANTWPASTHRASGLSSSGKCHWVFPDISNECGASIFTGWEVQGALNPLMLQDESDRHCLKTLGNSYPV
jgi:hypothetical protein